MKVLQISASDRGGAGIAAVRLHEALLRAGVDSKLLTLAKHRTDIQEHYVYHSTDVARFPLFARLILLINRVLKRLRIKSDYYRSYRNRRLEGRVEGYDAFSFSVSEHRLERHPLIADSDIVHLHWPGDGFLDFTRFFTKVSKKVVWTLHDMNPFTGGCHHADDCKGYMTDCKNCPQLEGTADQSRAQKMLSVKMNVLSRREDEMTIVAPSRWLMNCSKQSALFKRYNHHHIHNVIEDEVYYVTDKQASRELLSLPQDKKIILCVAHNVDNLRKGYDTLLAALEHVNTEDILLFTVGSMAKAWQGNASIVQLGYITESAKMREAYNAADVFVLPSMAENFPNTIVEAHLCGTPAVAFDIGGISEQITQSNGLLVKEMNNVCLAEALDHYFDKMEQYNRHDIARHAAHKYASSVTANKYQELYGSIFPDDYVRSGITE